MTAETGTIVLRMTYRYGAMVTEKGHRNPGHRRLRGTAPVAFRTMSEAAAPVAARIAYRGDTYGAHVAAEPTRVELRHDGTRFLRPLLAPDGGPMGIEAFAAAMEGAGMTRADRYGRQEQVEWADNPLIERFKDQNGKMRAHALFDLRTREEIESGLRRWDSDDTLAEEAKLRQLAEGIAVVGGIMHRTCPEPTWTVTYGYGETYVKLDPDAPRHALGEIRFPLDRHADALALARRLAEDGKEPGDRDAAEVVLPGCLRRDARALNAATLFRKVSPAIAADLPALASGSVARGYADLKDAEAAWRAGEPGAIHAGYVALRRIVEADWTPLPVKDKGSPRKSARASVIPFLVAYEEFERGLAAEDDTSLGALAPAA